MAKHTSSDELNGAEPVPAPISTPLPAQKKARARKAPPEAAEPSSPEPAPDYAALGIAEADVPRAESLRLEFVELGRRSTSQVFECGRVVTALHELATDQQHFARLAKGVLKLSRTGAENYSRVHLNLSPYRERLLRVGMIASGLYDLATAEPEKVEEVLAAREAGQELTGGQIKAILGKGDAPASASPDDGGVAELKARIVEKTHLGVTEFMDGAATFHEALLVALEPHRQGKRIVVKDTQPAFIYPARILREQLEWLTWRAVPEEPGRYPVFHVPVVLDDRWHELWRTLVKLGGFEDWPPAAEVGPWLADTVVPQLVWLLGGRARKALAVIDKMAAATEAERVKAEKERERAKAEQKKLREKARLESAKAGKHGSRLVAAVADLSAAMASAEEEAASSALQVAIDA